VIILNTEHVSYEVCQLSELISVPLPKTVTIATIMSNASKEATTLRASDRLLCHDDLLVHIPIFAMPAANATRNNPRRASSLACCGSLEARPVWRI
jgi:hypothetical protein